MQVSGSDQPEVDVVEPLAVAVLGPLAVTVNGQPVAVAGERLRLLRLAMDDGTPVSRQPDAYAPDR